MIRWNRGKDNPHTEWVLRKRISAIPNEIFPDGKVKYFLRKCEILLTQYEICPWGILRYHFVMIKIQNALLQNCNRAFFYSVLD